MPSMENDLDAAKQFSNDLKTRVDELRNTLKETDSLLCQVAEGWKDVQFQQFETGFTDDKNFINPLCDTIDEFVGGPLQRTIVLLETYLNEKNNMN